MRFATALVGLIAVSALPLFAQDDATKLIEPRNVTVKAPASKVSLTLAIPVILKQDNASAAKYKMVAAFDTEGKDLTLANCFLTVDFDPKGLADGSTADIKTYFGYQMEQLTDHIPNLQFSHWQPAHLNPDKVNFMAIETKPDEEKHYAPEHMLVLEVADGFYTISFHTRDAKLLDVQPVTDIFDSLEGLNPDAFVSPSAAKPQPLRDVTVTAVQSRSTLHLALPADFQDDKTFAAARGYSAAYAAGGDATHAAVVVTVEFHPKSPSIAETHDLENFFAWWQNQSRRQFPNAEMTKWAPQTALANASFRSVAIDGDAKKGVPLTHVVALESPEGYFIVIGYGATSQLLNGGELSGIMNSVSLRP